MTWLQGRRLPLAVLVAAVAALIVSFVWATGSHSGRPGPGHGPMMGVVSREQPVHSMADANRAAARFADRWGLHVGEVMQFTNNYYAELLDRGGNRATEVLVDPGSGIVQVEFGPAMMWNTSYGMMRAPAPTSTAAVGPDQAVRIADGWLSKHRTGLHAAEPDQFPGYYTLHTLRDSHIVGMLSVNATTGQVWNHTWHSRFIQMQEPRSSA
ncbi:hypothetical protein ACFV2Z_37025 [Streptomyces sp. NPDC059688]|uniref:hypothetical protein n=1 Tax=Streptomyces sp. NPDC059688 TaxID=3346906 RepID=UPI0036A10033